MSNIIEIAPSNQIKYKIPDNFVESDRDLFYDVNFMNLIPAVEMVTIENITISNKYIFSQCTLLDQYTNHTSVSFRVWIKTLLKKYLKIGRAHV